MVTPDAQVRKLMESYEKDGKIGVAGLRAGVHRNTASKYIKGGQLPSDLKKPRSWKTRKDPFERYFQKLCTEGESGGGSFSVNELDSFGNFGH